MWGTHKSPGDLEQTQSALGHSGIRITRGVHVHLPEGSEVEFMQKVEERTSGGELCPRKKLRELRSRKNREEVASIARLNKP